MDVSADEAIEDLIRPGVVTTSPDATLREVAQLLTDESVGLVVVTDQGGMVGVISERDIVSSLADGSDPDEIWAADVMSDDPICVDPEDSLLFAADRMINTNVRHLPILGAGEPIGVVSMRDLLAALTEVVRSA